MNKSYILKRDMLFLKAGTIFTKKDGEYFYEGKDMDGYERIIDKKYIENNPEWFDEIKEKQKEKIKVSCFSYFGMEEENHYQYNFCLNYHIHNDAYNIIKKAIEDVLNKDNEPVEGFNNSKESLLNKLIHIIDELTLVQLKLSQLKAKGVGYNTFLKNTEITNEIMTILKSNKNEPQ